MRPVNSPIDSARAGPASAGSPTVPQSCSSRDQGTSGCGPYKLASHPLGYWRPAQHPRRTKTLRSCLSPPHPPRISSFQQCIVLDTSKDIFSPDSDVHPEEGVGDCHCSQFKDEETERRGDSPRDSRPIPHARQLLMLDSVASCVPHPKPLQFWHPLPSSLGRKRRG